jgi:dihydroorotate dehydrogenase (NAD+) catalytic subunit
VGLRAFLEMKLPEAAKLPAPLVASGAATTPGGFEELVREMAAREEIAAVELNVSCPNVERGRCPLWADAVGVGEVVAASRAQTDKTLLLKLSPNAADVVSIAEAAEGAGADALVVANTLPGMRIDLERRRPALGNVTGGLSGAALMPVNLALVWSVSQAVDLPVVGSGGVRSADDALEYMMAGATAVQVGTAIFADPRTPSRVAAGLLARMKTDGVESPASYVGAAHGKADRCHQKVVTG